MTRQGWLLRVIFLGCVAHWLATPASAQTTVQERSQNVDQLFNWYYASVFGTGYYKIGEESVAVVRLPFAYTLREPSEEHWGIKLTFPVAAAFARFDLQDFDLGNVSTAGLSVLPGIEAQIPVGKRWTVKPFANVGMGRDFQHDTNALIYSVGVSSIYQRPINDNVLSAVGAKLTYAGYQSGGEKSVLGALSVGGDLGFPLRKEISGRPLILGTQLIGTVYFNNLDFLMPGSGTEKVSSEVEVGLTLSVRRPFEVLGIGFDRIGIAYRRGSNDLRGVRLVGAFPF